MILGDHAAALGRGVERDSGLFDERLQLARGLRPQHAAAGDHDRARGSLQHRQQGVDLGRARLRPAAPLEMPGLRPLERGGVDLLVQDIAREIEVDRAGLARHRAAERLVQVLGQALGLMHARRPLGARRHHRQLVDLLERAAAPGANRRAAAERDDRHAVRPGVRDPGDQVGHARARGGHAHAGPQAQARVGVRHHRGGLLVAHVDAAQPALQRLRLDHEHRRAHDEEEHVHALPLERRGQDLRSVHVPRPRSPNQDRLRRPGLQLAPRVIAAGAARGRGVLRSRPLPSGPQAARACSRARSRTPPRCRRRAAAPP